jgi:hypothetical protein
MGRNLIKGVKDIKWETFGNLGELEEILRKL